MKKKKYGKEKIAVSFLRIDLVSSIFRPCQSKATIDSVNFILICITLWHSFGSSTNYSSLTRFHLSFTPICRYAGTQHMHFIYMTTSSFNKIYDNYEKHFTSI